MTNYEYKYLIIGGSMTADAAVASLNDSDPDGSVGLIGLEKDPPYARPPLTKDLWKGDEELNEIFLETPENDVTMHLGRLVKEIDRSSKKVVDAQGNEYNYEKLLIATGGAPRKIPKIDVEGIIYYRTVEDYKKSKKLVDENLKFGIIGGGFIGSEIAAGIKIYKPEAQVTMLFPEEGVCARLFPSELTRFLTDYYNDKGITVHPGELVVDIKKQEEQYIVDTKSGKSFEFDVVIAGLGIEPNVKLAKEAGLTVDNGIIVDEYLQTDDPDIFAAGDVARYHHPMLERKVRVEHEDNAVWAGYYAALNMAGEETPAEHISMFYSDLFDLGYEAVGELNSELETVEDWIDPFNKGVVYYLKDGNVRGVLLWNVWEKLDDARELMLSSKSFVSDDLKGKIR